MLTVCVQDILHRLNEVKAQITSVYGDILKIVSSKKVSITNSQCGIGTISTWVMVASDVIFNSVMSYTSDSVI